MTTYFNRDGSNLWMGYGRSLRPSEFINVKDKRHYHLLETEGVLSNPPFTEFMYFLKFKIYRFFFITNV